MTEPTTAEGRALLGLDMAPESGYWVSLGAGEMRDAILAIEAAAAEAERARMRAVREAAQMAMEVLMRLQLHDLPEHRGDVDAVYEGLRAALAAIDAPGTAPAEPRCDFDCDACRSTPEAAEKMDVSEGHAIVIPAMWPRLILERERARIRAAVETMTDYSDEPDSMWVRRAVVLAAIDDEARRPPPAGETDVAADKAAATLDPHGHYFTHAAIDDETLHERQVRLNYERPGRAAIDDEARQLPPEWRDDSGHWIGGNVGMPEAAAEAERARIIRLTLWAMREVGPRLLTTPADQEAAFKVVAPLVLAAIDDEAIGS